MPCLLRLFSGYDIWMIFLFQEEVQAHFNCDQLEGAELEDQGVMGTALTHWEKRIFEVCQNCSISLHGKLVTVTDTGRSKEFDNPPLFAVSGRKKILLKSFLRYCIFKEKSILHRIVIILINICPFMMQGFRN